MADGGWRTVTVRPIERSREGADCVSVETGGPGRRTRRDGSRCDAMRKEEVAARG